MADPARPFPSKYCFGPFEFDPLTGTLRKSGYRIRLQQQPREILQALLERPGQIVTREELRQRLWPETVVDYDHSLNAAIKRLRFTLNDATDDPRYIETISRRGYRFRGTLADAAEPAPEDVPARGPAHSAKQVPRWAFAALAVVAVAGAIALWIRPYAFPSRGDTQRIALAVLPFENMTRSTDQESLCDGITEEMITQLGRLHHDRLRVIARTSVMRYKGTVKTATQIGEELGVSHILQGSVRRNTNRIRITAQLIHARDHTQLWAETYDGDSADTLALQSEVARRVAESLALALWPRTPSPSRSAGPAPWRSSRAAGFLDRPGRLDYTTRFASPR
jgi:TolB-like protein/DNA-binding winged helix-turn-helix (wHTH) protein